MHERQISLPCASAVLLWLAGFGVLTYGLVTHVDDIGRLGLAICVFAGTVSGWAIATKSVVRLSRDVFELGRDTGRLEAERRLQAIR